MADTDRKETRAERLDRLIRKVIPNLKSNKEGLTEWGPSGAPYVFSTLEDGRTKLTVENPETGDRVGVVGSDYDDVLNQLEDRVKG